MLFSVTCNVTCVSCRHHVLSPTCGVLSDISSWHVIYATCCCCCCCYCCFMSYWTTKISCSVLSSSNLLSVPLLFIATADRSYSRWENVCLSFCVCVSVCVSCYRVHHSRGRNSWWIITKFGTAVGNHRIQVEFIWGRKRNSFSGLIAHARNIPIKSISGFLSSPLWRPQFLTDLHWIWHSDGQPENTFRIRLGSETEFIFYLIAHARNIPMQKGFLSSPLWRPQFVTDPHQIWQSDRQPENTVPIRLGVGNGIHLLL
jgi:hypothetical protein